MNALDPLKVKTSDGAVWVRAAVTQSGRGLYALEGVASCPRFVMATLDELAVRGVKAQSELADAVAELGALPMPTGTADVAAPMTPQQYNHIRAHLNEAAQRFGGINYVSPTFGLVRDAIAEVDRLRAESSQLTDDVTGACLARHEEEQENTRLRERVAELEAQAEKVTSFCDARAEYITALLNCHPDNGHDYDRWQGHAAARRQLSELLGLPVAWPAEADARPVPTPSCAFKNPHEAHTNEPGRVDEYQCPGVPKPALRGRERIDATAAEDAEATHWKRLGVTSPEDPHDSPLRHDYAVPRDLPTGGAL